MKEIVPKMFMLQPEIKVYFGISVVILKFPYPYKERRKQYDADINL